MRLAAMVQQRAYGKNPTQYRTRCIYLTRRCYEVEKGWALTDVQLLTTQQTIMNFQIYPPAENLRGETLQHLIVNPDEPTPERIEQSIHVNEVIRIKVQLVIHTEDCVAAGCAEGIW